MIINGTALWAKVIGQPRDNIFDPSNRTWTIDLVVNKDTIKKLKSEGLGWRLKKLEQAVGDVPEGSDFVKFKRNEFYIERKTGDKKRNQPIEVIDAYGKPWDGVTLIGNGSEVNVRFRTYEGFKKQTQAMIDAIQVVKLVPFGSAPEPFPVKNEGEEGFNDDISHIGNDEDEVIV